jgi:hypothetical protein
VYDEDRQDHLNYKYRVDPRDVRPEEKLTDYEIAIEALKLIRKQLGMKLYFCATKTTLEALERLKEI